jgi:hypothetical protein
MLGLQHHPSASWVGGPGLLACLLWVGVVGVGLLFEIWIVDASIWRCTRRACLFTVWVWCVSFCFFAHLALIVGWVCGSFVACHECASPVWSRAYACTYVCMYVCVVWVGLGWWCV